MCNKEESGSVKKVPCFPVRRYLHQRLHSPQASKGERETRVIEWWRNARDHGKQKEEARRLARVLLPAFLSVEIYIKRENYGKEAAGDQAGVQTL